MRPIPGAKPRKRNNQNEGSAHTEDCRNQTKGYYCDGKGQNQTGREKSSGKRENCIMVNLQYIDSFSCQ
jgi:hypothetical protein